MKKNERGITLIALVVTIVVLLILAGVSISMLTGENGIITQAQESKLQTEIGKEKEYITLSVSAIRGEKISKGDTSEITSSELQIEMNKYTDEATVTGSGTLTVTYESGRSYDVEQNGNITQKEELTPEEAKKIVFATGFGEALLVETADGTVYYVDDLQTQVMQKIEITDAKIITTKGIKKVEDKHFIDNEGKVYIYKGELNNEIECMSDILGNALNGRNIIDIQCSSAIIALDSEGKVYTWGNNVDGELGNGMEVGFEQYSSEPQCISDIPGNVLNGKKIIKIQNGDAVIALDSGGKVYTWGSNYYGKLGNGTDIEYANQPQCISDIPGNVLNGKNIIEIQGEYYIMIALDNEGKVYTWGSNNYGKLGNGTDIKEINEPQCISDIERNVLNGKKIIKIQNDNTVIALDSEGKLYTWGNNVYGGLGNGMEVGFEQYSSEPQCISDIPGNILNEKKIIKIQNSDAVIALDSGGKVYTWGRNYYGELGNGMEDDSNVPICISDMTGNELNGKKVVEIQSYNHTMIALDSEGKLYMWGSNLNGEIAITSEEIVKIPICITDSEETELYNKKIKTVKTYEPYINTISFITQEGELYNYCFETSPM